MSISHKTFIGLTRLMAIFFAMMGLDSLCASALTYALRRSALAVTAPQTVDLLPSTDAFYLPLFGVYVLIAALVWLLAPFISSVALPSDQPMSDTTPELGSGPFLIFGFGLVLITHSIERLVDIADEVLRHPTDLNRLPHLVLFGLMLGTGALLIVRLGITHRWITRISQDNPE